MESLSLREKKNKSKICCSKSNEEIEKLANNATLVRESESFLNSGFYAMDSEFYHCKYWIPDSLSGELGFRISVVSGIPESFLDPYFGFKSPGFSILQANIFRILHGEMLVFIF